MKEVMDYATGIQHVGIPCKSIEETKSATKMKLL